MPGASAGSVSPSLAMTSFPESLLKVSSVDGRPPGVTAAEGGLVDVRMSVDPGVLEVVKPADDKPVVVCLDGGDLVDGLRVDGPAIDTNVASSFFRSDVPPTEGRMVSRSVFGSIDGLCGLTDGPMNGGW